MVMADMRLNNPRTTAVCEVNSPHSARVEQESIIFYADADTLPIYKGLDGSYNLPKCQ